MENNIIYANRIQFSLNDNEGVLRFFTEIPSADLSVGIKKYDADNPAKTEIRDESVIILSRKRTEELFDLMSELLKADKKPKE